MNVLSSSTDFSPLEEEIDLNSMNEQQLANYQHWISLVKKEFTSNDFYRIEETFVRWAEKDGSGPYADPYMKNPFLKITLKLKEENINYRLPFYETFMTLIFRNGVLIKKYSTMLFLVGIDKETGKYQYEQNIGERNIGNVINIDNGLSSKELTQNGKYEIQEIAMLASNNENQYKLDYL